MYQWLVARNIQQAALKAFIRKEVDVCRVHNVNTVYSEAVRIDIWLYRAYSDTPYTLTVFHHRHLSRRELAVQYHFFGIRRPVTKGHFFVGMYFWRHDLWSGWRLAHRKA